MHICKVRCICKYADDWYANELGGEKFGVWQPLRNK